MSADPGSASGPCPWGMIRALAVFGLVLIGSVAAVLVVVALIRGQKTEFQLRHDPIEDDPALRPMFEAAAREAKLEMEAIKSRRNPPGMYELGDGKWEWVIKKRILKEKYGIDWRTPEELNPNVRFE